MNLTNYNTEVNRGTLRDLALKLIDIRKASSSNSREVSGFIDALNTLDPSNELADRVTHIANHIEMKDPDYL